MTRFAATYWIETPFPLEKAAQTLAAEQSSGTFVAVPGETDELKARHAARVESIEPLEVVDTPSLPAPTDAKTFHRARVERIHELLETLTSLGQARMLEDGRFVAPLAARDGRQYAVLDGAPQRIEDVGHRGYFPVCRRGSSTPVARLSCM